MALQALQCAWCSVEFTTKVSYVNRAAKIGAPMYCGKVCAGLARRNPNPLTPEQKKEAKRQYDAEYRKKNAAKRKAQKADWYQRTRDPEKERAIRKANMPRHIEYCRRPEYRAYKQQYDRAYRAKKEFGEFADAALLLQEIEREVDARATRYDIYLQNGTINKAQSRRRAL